VLGRRAEAKTILERLIAQEPKLDEAPAEPAAEADAGARPDEHGARQAPALPSKSRPWVDWLMGVIQFEEGNLEEALACLLRAEQAEPRLPSLHLRIGETWLRQKRLDEAERAFQKALDIDGDSPEAHLGLARVHLGRRRNEEAAEEALLAVSLQHFLPFGHFYLGVALARLGHPHRAAVAFETSLTMLPGLVPAHRWLAAVYGQPGGNPAKAAQHRRLFAELRRKRELRTQSEISDGALG